MGEMMASASDERLFSSAFDSSRPDYVTIETTKALVSTVLRKAFVTIE
jgi:hypothetical protein